MFYLTTLHVDKVLTEDPATNPPTGIGTHVPSVIENATYHRIVDSWNCIELYCRNYILNALDDSLYDIYSTFKSARAIWESLEIKHKTKYACSKKSTVGKFLHYKMSDAKSIVKQVKEIQILAHELDVEGMGLHSNFLVGSIIEKITTSWKDFKLYLKHLTEEMSFEKYVLKLHVEEDHKKNEKVDAVSLEASANFVVGSTSNKSKIQEFKSKGKASTSKNDDKTGYKAKDCRFKKGGNNDGNGGNSRNSGGKSGNPGSSNQENVIESTKLFVGIIETNLVSNGVDWWVDIGATRHICNSKSMFTTYQQVDDGEPMFMGNATTTKVEGQGKVNLKLTSGKDLMLTNVFHVPAMTKNLISGPMLSNKGFKMVFESDKFVLTKGPTYVGKGYLYKGLFKLSVVPHNDAFINKNNAGTSAAPSM
ncbi:uncharacterized protein LOC111915387 [Lactuca sativa]|uniref:uncharacterized protein LOC111915387 n=1 Tax=Lactuca sativa TaxID=4236 RepID=UPI000CD8B75E|nr:uncharacterized protein LOC111915387 [Lactuca sativa]